MIAKLCFAVISYRNDGTFVTMNKEYGNCPARFFFVAFRFIHRLDEIDSNGKMIRFELWYNKKKTLAARTHVPI